ncbi:hypothetical protein ACO0LO_18925 [Undibacterium sp. TJN25]|uniref:hypothetical protein n=1 Tax=Undibacterium sp. TJN25 TaxID=3413056 RepID=UPI003BF2E035
MLTGKVTHLSADATEAGKSSNQQNNTNSNGSSGGTADNTNPASTISTYKAKVQLDKQVLVDAQGNKLLITPGMQVVAEINQGKRTVLEYLSPVQKATQEAAREK